MHEATSDRVETGALARPAERSSAKLLLTNPSYKSVELRSTKTGDGARPHVVRGAQRGKGSGISARAYPMTAIAVAFSRSSWGTILSSVSAAV
jgi:hypothetical protein